MPTEPIPVNEFITDLENQWTHTNVPSAGKKPGFIEVTGAGEPMRYNLNVNDQIIARATGPALQEIPIGNRKFGNRIYNIIIIKIFNITFCNTYSPRLIYYLFLFIT